MVGIGVRDGIVRHSLPRALCLYDRNIREANQNEGWHRKEERQRRVGMMKLTCQYRKGAPDDAMQKRREG